MRALTGLLIGIVLIHVTACGARTRPGVVILGPATAVGSIQVAEQSAQRRTTTEKAGPSANAANPARTRRVDRSIVSTEQPRPSVEYRGGGSPTASIGRTAEDASLGATAAATSGEIHTQKDTAAAKTESAPVADARRPRAQTLAIALGTVLVTAILALLAKRFS
jgi:hypothetical protein